MLWFATNTIRRLCLYKRNWLRKLLEEFGWTDGLRLGLRTDLHKVIALVAKPLRGWVATKSIRFEACRPVTTITGIDTFGSRVNITSNLAAALSFMNREIPGDSDIKFMGAVCRTSVGVQKAMLTALMVCSLKRSTAEAFVVPWRVLRREIFAMNFTSRRNNRLYRCWLVPIRIKKKTKQNKTKTFQAKRRGTEIVKTKWAATYSVEDTADEKEETTKGQKNFLLWRVLRVFYTKKEPHNRATRSSFSRWWYFFFLETRSRIVSITILLVHAYVIKVFVEKSLAMMISRPAKHHSQGNTLSAFLATIQSHLNIHILLKSVDYAIIYIS